MGRLSAEQALGRARDALSAGGSAPGAVWPVYPPDGDQPIYYLVVLGRPEAAVGAAAVDARHGDVMAHAELPGREPHLALDGDEAVRRAGMSDVSRARMVWAPSRQSRSHLYPLWEVRGGRQIAYVDQTGRTWPTLEPGGPGGAPPTAGS